MESEAQKLAGQIKSLVEKLASIKEGHVSQVEKPVKIKGALGSIQMLIDENYFDSPRELANIMDKLKEIGHYHKINSISMNLLNLTKKRILNRFKNKETKNWEYVLRK